MRSAWRHPTFLAVWVAAVLVFALDRWTKAWAVSELALVHTKPLFGEWMRLTYVRNTGVAFGLFASEGGGNGLLLTLLGLGALAAVGVYFWLTPTRDRMLLMALALVVGGAIGNLIDRVSSGAVTDFIDVYVGSHHWPSFNVADSAISIGIVLMAIDSFRARKDPSPQP